MSAELPCDKQVSALLCTLRIQVSVPAAPHSHKVRLKALQHVYRLIVCAANRGHHRHARQDRLVRLQHLFALYSVLHLRLTLHFGICRTRRGTSADTRVSLCEICSFASARVHARAHTCTHAYSTRTSTRTRTEYSYTYTYTWRRRRRRTGASEHHVAHGPALSTPGLSSLWAGRMVRSGVGT